MLVYPPRIDRFILYAREVVLESAIELRNSKQRRFCAACTSDQPFFTLNIDRLSCLGWCECVDDEHAHSARISHCFWNK